MGATCVAVLIWNQQVHVGLVGDCRVYHWHDQKLFQRTRDQTLVERMVELGHLTEEEAANHPQRNEVTQAIGLRASIQPVHSEFLISPGDRLIVACDGLSGDVQAAELLDAVSKDWDSPGQLARYLVELANEQGGTDNCTVAVVFLR
jgi:protein phosphatase